MMIRVYYLVMMRVAGVDQFAGSEYVHNAIVGVEGTLRYVIQDTTEDEHNGLVAVAESWREATAGEITKLGELPTPEPPSADYLRACELLAMSPPVITMPEIWELLRIFGRRLGYREPD